MQADGVCVCVWMAVWWRLSVWMAVRGQQTASKLNLQGVLGYLGRLLVGLAV